MPPGGGGMPMMAAADSVAPKCPECDSHSTALVSDDGSCECSNCKNRWSVPLEMASDSAPHNIARTAVEHDHVNPEGVPSADQIGQDDAARDINPGSWADQEGNPLKVGSQYEMYSARYDIPDVVQITAIKPDSVEYNLTGAYNLGHRTEVTKQEADMDGLTFVAMDDVQQQPTPDDVQQPDSHEFSLQAKIAGKRYTPMQQREFIDEPGVARNADKLDLAGTHYEDEPGLTDDFYLFGL
jgi:hypothetical protein